MKKFVLVDDIDGSEATETIRFGVDGNLYEIDLSQGNAQELRTTLARYSDVARPTRLRNGTPKNSAPASPAKPASRKASGKRNGTPRPSEVREWAKSRGIDVNATGRVPSSLVEQYLADVSSS